MGIIRVPFYAVCMLLTAPGKLIFFLSGKLRRERDLENTENVCGLLIGLAVYNLLRSRFSNLWARIGVAVLIAVVVIVIFHLAVRNADSAREAIQYYMRPFARYYDHCLAEIRRRLGIGKRKRVDAGAQGKEGNRADAGKQGKEKKHADAGAQGKEEKRADAGAQGREEKRAERSETDGRGGKNEEQDTRESRRSRGRMGERHRMTPFEEAKSLFNVELPYSLEEIRDKRNLLLKTYHPDNQNGSEEMCKKINECYDLLAKYI